MDTVTVDMSEGVVVTAALGASGRVRGVQVKIMKTWDPTGRDGPKTPLPDVVVVHTPKVRRIQPKTFT